MAVSFVGVGAAVDGTSSPLTVPLPTVAADDYIFLVVSVDATGGSAITASGYTELTSETNVNATPDKVLTVLYKRAGASESNPQVAASAGAGNGFYAFAFALRGVDTTTPFDGVTPVDSTADATTDFTPTGVTTGSSDAWAVSVACSDENNALALKTGSEQGFTDRASGTSYHTLTGGDNSFGLATKLVAAAGAVTMPTWTATVNAPTNYVGTSFSVRETAPVSASVSPATVNASAAIAELGAETSTTVTPDGIAASSTVSGSPNASATVNTSTVSVVVAVGGSVSAAEYQTFTTPTDRRPFAGAFHQWRWDRGRTVYRKDGVWHEVTDPLWSDINTADLVAAADRPGGERTDGTDRDRYLFLGGREYEVSDAVAAELTTAGYGGNLS